MKLAKAMLLYGELVEAIECDYADTARFQLICPNCAEPVFKRVRDETHYFAHYRGHPDDCELRVGRIAANEVAQSRALSREQLLSQFLRQFRDIIAGLVAKAAPSPKGWRTRIEQQMTIPRIGQISGWIKSAETFFEDRPNALAELDGGRDLSRLERTRLQHLVTDVYRHLSTEKASINRRFFTVAVAWFSILRHPEFREPIVELVPSLRSWYHNLHATVHQKFSTNPNEITFEERAHLALAVIAVIAFGTAHEIDITLNLARSIPTDNNPTRDRLSREDAYTYAKEAWPRFSILDQAENFLTAAAIELLRLHQLGTFGSQSDQSVTKNT